MAGQHASLLSSLIQELGGREDSPAPPRFGMSDACWVAEEERREEERRGEGGRIYSREVA